MGRSLSTLPNRFRGFCGLVKQFFITMILCFHFFRLQAFYETPSIEKQIELLKEVGYKIGPEVLAGLTKELSPEEKDKFIINLLKTYDDPNIRQALVNETLDKELSYEILFQNLTEKQCADVGCRANPQYISALPVIDFLNGFHLPSFFQPTLKNALIHRGHYNMFNSFDQVGLWVEPFGHFTSFNQYTDQKCPSKISPYRFNLKTLGISIGGEYTVTPKVVINMGLAYSHSNIEWKSSAHSSLNTIYVGPSISYLLPYTYFSLLFLGTVNFYDMNRTTILFPDTLTKKTPAHSRWVTWDLTGRFEGGFSFPLKWGFYLYPLAQVDYIHISIQKSTETLYKRTNLTINSFCESFFESTVALKITKEVFKEDLGFIIPHTLMGWVYYMPMQQADYTYQIPGCTKKFKEQNILNSWSQYMFGLGISILHKRGIFLSLSYEFFTGYSSPTHLGKARVAWTW